MVWHTPKFLESFKCKFEGENNGRRRSWGPFLSSQHFRRKKDMLELWGGDYDKWQVGQLFTQTYTNQTISCLVHSYITFGAWMSHKHTRTHKIQHGPNLGEATTFPLIVLFVPGHRGCTQMSFCHGIPKLGVSKFLLALWRPITSCVYLWLRWYLK